MEPINRKILKENAKAALKNNFWMVMLVALVGSFLGVGFNGLGGGKGSSVSNSFLSGFNAVSNGDSSEQILERIRDALNSNMPDSDFDFHYDDGETAEENVEEFLDGLRASVPISDEELLGGVLVGAGVFLLVFVLIYLLAMCIRFAVGSFLSAPVTVGYYRFFMKNRKNEADFKDLFAVFSKGNYKKVVKAMFATNIRIWAWSLLFYFPGLIKSYQYFFVPYIMAENPDISKERARELSSEMTNGHKWQIFLLQLSFLGWILVFVLEEVLLTLISCGILVVPGMFLFYPLVGYKMATFAELYEERREYALVSGMASGAELIGF